MLVRGIRGAITVNSNKKEEIIERTKELLIALLRENNFKIEDLVSILFSATPDLNAAFPARAARFAGPAAGVHFPLSRLPEAGPGAASSRG